MAVVAGFQGIAGGTSPRSAAGSDDGGGAAGSRRKRAAQTTPTVDGVYTRGPERVPAARKLDRISYQVEEASLGAKVLQIARWSSR